MKFSPINTLVLFVSLLLTLSVTVITATPIQGNQPSVASRQLSGVITTGLCIAQPSGSCSLSTLINTDQTGGNEYADGYIFDSSCNLIGYSSSMWQGTPYDFDSELPYVVVVTINLSNSQPSFDYAGSHYPTPNSCWLTGSDPDYVCSTGFTC